TRQGRRHLARAEVLVQVDEQARRRVPEPVLTGFAEQLIDERVAQDRVGSDLLARSGHLQEVGVVGAAGDGAGDAANAVGIAVGAAPLGNDGSRGRDVPVEAGGAADEDVVFAAAVQEVGAEAADEDVAAGAADQPVVAGAAQQDVAAVAADQDVVAGPAVDDGGDGGLRGDDGHVVAGPTGKQKPPGG